MKKFIAVIICLCSVVSGYSQIFNDRFENYSISVGYERVDYGYADDLYDVRVSSDNINFNVLAYGVYIDASVSVNAKRQDYYNPYTSTYYRRDVPTVLSMDFGYAIPLFPKDSPVRVFITPMVGFTTLSKNWYRTDCEFNRYYSNGDRLYCTKINVGGSIGVSIGHVYIQGKYTTTSAGASIGYMF